jgi:hypothetical protein
MYEELFYKAIINGIGNGTGVTIGAFLPIFLLMYGHYLIRKSFYKKAKDFYKNMKDFNLKEQESADRVLEKYYKHFNVNNQIELFEKVKTEFKKYEDILKIVADQEHEKNKAKLELMKNEAEYNYLETYNFRDYIIGILQRKFPDNRFENKND